MKIITSKNIGSIRRFLFVPWSSWWNAFVRDITAKIENKEEYEIKNNVKQWIVWKQENKWAYLWLVSISISGGFIFGIVFSTFIN